MKSLFPDLLLPTTVVGSYPVVMGKGLSAILDPYRPAVMAAVDDQVAAGIDIISDGQVRGDMVKIYTSALPGIRGNEVVGPVLAASGPITLRDTRYALTRASRVKGIITGPTTLSFALHLSTPVYRDREDLAMDLARALSQEAVYLQGTGVTMIQVDEPILSTGAASMEAAGEAIRTMARELRIPVSLHVCGSLKGIIDQLIQMPVAVLDFEFSRSPENLAICGDSDFGEKMVGFGCVDSASPEVETVDQIRRRIERGLAMFSPEQLLIDPDCGLRMLDRDTALQKLVRMVGAVKEVREGLEGSNHARGS
jgi:5-methyltetrahydropteroyltriglutamate--homocysteine methyltransferase